jgi:hypothetical protein
MIVFRKTLREAHSFIQRKIPGPIRKQALSSISSQLQYDEGDGLRDSPSNMEHHTISTSVKDGIEGGPLVEKPREKGVKKFLSTKASKKGIMPSPRSRDVDSSSVLNIFRVNLSNLKLVTTCTLYPGLTLLSPFHRKRDKYQILAFTLDSPLSDTERTARKVVRSERVL